MEAGGHPEKDSPERGNIRELRAASFAGSHSQGGLPQGTSLPQQGELLPHLVAGVFLA